MSQFPESASNNQSTSTGSPPPGEPVFIVVGRLRRPHGLAGEILVDVLTEFPERLVVGKVIYAGVEHNPLKIRSVRGHQSALLMLFEEYTDCDSARELTNQLIYVKADKLPPLPEGQYYHHELLGLTVRDETGQVLGILVEILETGANDVYIVKRQDAPEELLLPAIESVVMVVDLKKKELIVRPPIWD